MNVLAWQEVFALQGPQYLTVNFLNVGQGDSAFIETPENQQIIIDGGPDATSLEKVSGLMPFWDKEIDVVILSHPESDHMQGLMDILRQYKADYILWSGVKKTTAEYFEWLNVLNRQKNFGAKIISVKAGDKIKAGNVLVEILYPLENLEGKEMKNSSNDSCVVAKIIYGKNSFLFSGDIDAKAEKELDNADADVLKVAHHGSKYSTSEEFLEAVNPFVAAISVGKNSYGHPTAEVLQKLQKFGIKVERTDEAGDIKIVSDGKTIKLIK